MVKLWAHTKITEVWLTGLGVKEGSTTKGKHHGVYCGNGTFLILVGCGGSYATLCMC